jgi:Zn-dependent peptidase ImmA (M78 family)/DNA-binding XRE family transcriptional regulator
MSRSSIHLGDIRDHLGLSQREVASQLAVDPSLVSRWERGDRTPSTAQWLQLAALYGVPHDYLHNPSVRAVFKCRAQVTMTAAEKASTRHALVAGEAQVHALNEAWKLAGRAPDRMELKLEYSEPRLIALAEQLREYLKLNARVTFEELKESAQERHIHVFEWHLPPKLSGFSYRGAFTVIFVNRDHSEPRRLFTLAHELAHVLFHLGPGQETAVSAMASTRDPQEKQANAFAAEILMPKPRIEGLVRERGRDALRDPKGLKQAADDFNVSAQALFYRLAQFDVFSWSEKTNYFSKGESSPTPVALVTDWAAQVDSDLAQTLIHLRDQELLSTGKVAEWSCTERYVVERHLESRAGTELLPAELFDSEILVP